MSVKEAIEVISKEIKSDHGYAIGWQSNIAMCFIDEFKEQLEENSDVINYELLHSISNKAALRFLTLLTMNNK